MVCGKCGTQNDSTSKFCKSCGVELGVQTSSQSANTLSELYGKEVEVLFFIENFTGKVSGIVNPSEDQIGRYREGLLQRVTIEAPSSNPSDESVGAILTFIRQSKEYLGEEFHEVHYNSFSLPDLKKEYLKLFERVLKMKEKRGDSPKAVDPKTEKK